VFSTEEPAERDGDFDTLRITPGAKDQEEMAALVRFELTKPDGRKYWKEEAIMLSEHGATILTEPLQ
jgi:hypothetical protein